MHIRSVTSADIPALTALEYQHYKAEGYPEAFLFQAYRQWPQMLWLASDNSVVAGYVLCAPGAGSSEAWIMSALVAADYRGLGVGSALMGHALSHLTDQGFSTIYLSVAPTNTGALKLYQKLGFVVLEQKDNYLGAGEHRLIMRYKPDLNTCSGTA
ncbi:GNAT family N-acetyltransferase [Aliidiomarina iranensis]|uniref:GNAT family N-acetyltransferase n=1 Tax=Aliidiomarina iranensis TaxID=1434071 RepID=A0A432VTZ6_9GAMM|nr:N-acetyltransferase [Aliidiomarina iranensis]RUO19962.1 GNAT family N-acetyltransferase [Aliidiomarina iranensis]